MPSLVLGPLLRHAGEEEATVWVETDAPCTVEVLGHTARTFHVAGHHYALVVIRGLEPGRAVPYEVTLDDQGRVSYLYFLVHGYAAQFTYTYGGAALVQAPDQALVRPATDAEYQAPRGTSQ